MMPGTAKLKWWSRLSRQLISKHLIDIDFKENKFQTFSTISRVYQLSDTGINYLQTPSDIFVISPSNETLTTVATRKATTTAKIGQSSGRGKQHIQQIKELLGDEEKWFQVTVVFVKILQRKVLVLTNDVIICGTTIS